MLAMLLAGLQSAHALPSIERQGVKLVVQVVDDAQEVVSTGTVRIDDEGLRHRVNPRTGKWHGRAIYPDDREPTAFEPGQVLTLTAAAPGHLPRTVRYKLHPHHNTVRIPLQSLGSPPATEDDTQLDIATLLAVSRAHCTNPTPPTLLGSPAEGRGGPIRLDPETIRQLGDLETADPHLTTGFSEMLLAAGNVHLDDALAWADIAIAEAHTTEGNDYVGLVDDLYRIRAVAYQVRWQQAELTWLDEPTRKHRQALEQTRADAARIASDWVSWAAAADRDTGLPSALCLAASDRPLECTP